MKRLIILKLLVVNSCFGQWTNLGQGLDAQGRSLYYDSTVNSLIVIGNFTTANSLIANHIARWNGNAWDTLGSGAPAGAPGYSITKFQNQYYFSSVFYNLNPNDNWLAKWTGTIWDTIAPRFNDAVNCFEIYNNELFLGGTFSKMDTSQAPHIAKFDGVNFSTFPFAVSWGKVLAISHYQGQMYIGGNFYDSISQTNDLEIFDGNTFYPFPSGGLAFGTDDVTSFSVFNNDLYIGGSFSTQTGSTGNNIMRWNGSNMLPVLNGVNGPIRAMHVYNNNLYVCGAFTMADTISVSGIARWDGVRWHSLVPYSNDLLGISDFVILGNDLFITGSFSSIDGIPFNNIAKYSFSTSVLENSNNQFQLFPNPIKGDFSIRMSNMEGKKISIDIKNVFGQKVKEFKDVIGAGVFTGNLSELPNGVYFIITKSIENEQKFKIVKSN